MPGECPVHVLGSNALFHYSRYSDEQIPGVLYASVNPEYMTSTDGKASTASLFLFFGRKMKIGTHDGTSPCN